MKIENNLKGHYIQKQPKLRVAPMKIENSLKGIIIFGNSQN